jgi:ribosomal protein S18 acetylase RimI-like enzyme
MVGFLLARVADGEYGRPDAVGVIEAVGVDPAAQRAGIGRRLLGALDGRLRDRGIGALVTQADWRNRSMLRFLEGAGFMLAPRQILARRVHRMPLPETDEEIERVPPLVRHLTVDDADALLRIDRSLTGLDRGAYIRRKVDEALHESAISMSLVLEDDGFVVAYATLRVDLGDFGHVQPTASLDTLGVSPGFAHRGFARALLGQMIDNLAALHVETLETEVGCADFELARFLHRFGFRPSQRLAFERGSR